MRARPILLLAALAAGCPGGGDQGPRPEAIDPAFGDPAAAVPVVIRGRFRVKASQDLSSASGNAVDASYRAWLGGTPLGDVRWLDERTLSAVVPAGLAPGLHGLEVEDPTGRRGALAGAWLAGVPAPALSLAVTLSRATLSVGQALTVTVDVSNSGRAPAIGVLPAVALGGAGALSPGSAPPARDVAPGGTERFAYAFAAAGAGALTLDITATAPAPGGGTASATPWSGGVLVEVPAALTAALALPPAFLPGDFAVTFTVTNGGEAAALAVRPGALAVAPASAATAVEKVPFGPPQDIPGGESRSFTATFTASGAGALQLEGSAAGADANSGAAVATGAVISNLAQVGTAAAVELLAVDPFGDGTRFLQVNGWKGQLLVGPDDRALRLALLAPAGGPPSLRGLALPKDTNAAGEVSRNTWSGAPPYPSLGSSRCFLGNNDACGPDNESGRGLFATATVGGDEWAVAGWVREFGDARYLYMVPASADAAPFPFRYADLTRALGSGADGLTAAAAAGTALWAGLGGTTPKLVVFRAMPPTSGMDASAASQAEEMDLDLMPGVGRNGTPANPAVNPLVDALAVFGGVAHVANNGGMVRAAAADPRPYSQRPADWAPCTPSAAAWGAKGSVTTLLTSGVEPRGRAVPALVAWQGRLFALRNTTSGPQLWMCSPDASGDPSACDPDDWALAAPNLSGDGQLSQVNDAGNTRATLLAATAAWLYLGFDNGTTGVQLYRTTTATPANASDFRGQGGCLAGSAGCQGLGGNGLGDPSKSTRFQDARALSPPGGAGLYFTTGNGADPARLHRILD